MLSVPPNDQGSSKFLIIVIVVILLIVAALIFLRNKSLNAPATVEYHEIVTPQTDHLQGEPIHDKKKDIDSLSHSINMNETKIEKHINAKETVNSKKPVKKIVSNNVKKTMLPKIICETADTNKLKVELQAELVFMDPKVGKEIKSKEENILKLIRFVCIKKTPSEIVKNLIAQEIKEKINSFISSGEITDVSILNIKVIRE